MRARLLVNLALAVVIAGLAVVALYRPGASSSPGKTSATPITHLSPGKIRHIRVHVHGGQTFSLKRVAGRWQLVKPITFTADDGLIASLLRDFSEPSQKHFALKGHKLADFGLASPLLRVWLNHTEIDFGDTNPISGARYIKVGKSIYLARDTLFNRLDVAPLTFARKRLLPAGADITAIHLPGVSVIHAKQGGWRAKPAGAYANGAAQQLVDAWRGAYAMSVTAATAKNKAQIAQPVSIELAGAKAPLQFDVLKTAHGLDLLRSSPGLVFHLDPASRGQLLSLATPSSGHAKQGGAKPPASATGNSG